MQFTCSLDLASGRIWEFLARSDPDSLLLPLLNSILCSLCCSFFVLFCFVFVVVVFALFSTEHSSDTRALTLLLGIHCERHIKCIRKVRSMDKWFSAVPLGKSCIAVLDYFNYSCHLIPDIILDPFTSGITCQKLLLCLEGKPSGSWGSMHHF